MIINRFSQSRWFPSKIIVKVILKLMYYLINENINNNIIKKYFFLISSYLISHL